MGGRGDAEDEQPRLSRDICHRVLKLHGRAMVLSPLSRAPSCRAPRQRLRLHTAHLHRCGMSLRPSGEGPAGPPAKQRWQWRRRRRTAMAAAWALAVSCAALLAPGAGGAPLAFQHHEPQQSVPLIADNDPAATAAAAVGHGRRALAAPHVAAGGAPVRAVPHGAPPPHYTIEKHHDVPCPPSSPYNSTTARSKRPPRPTGARPLPPSVKVGARACVCCQPASKTSWMGRPHERSS